jgi:hypothetical protein
MDAGIAQAPKLKSEGEREDRLEAKILLVIRREYAKIR